MLLDRNSVPPSSSPKMLSRIKLLYNLSLSVSHPAEQYLLCGTESCRMSHRYHSAEAKDIIDKDFENAGLRRLAGLPMRSGADSKNFTDFDSRFGGCTGPLRWVHGLSKSL
ncbi:hypothetical protein N7G274_003691 [Stereocaulon virgatum]|uniref:Uncharacterized protein n=1 Tax=Stereocaulon virgatum TaxID=373712 RepID=A0ABR4AC93_9LECA